MVVAAMSVVYVLTTPIPEDELWNSLEAKYMDEDTSSKKFLVSNFTNYKMTDSRPVMEQYNKLLGILGRSTQQKINMDEAIQVSCIIDKLPPSWKDFKNTLKHNKEDLTLVEWAVIYALKRSLINRTKDVCSSMVPKEATEEVVTQQPESDLRKGKRNSTRKNFGPEFQLYLIKGTKG
ncbi:hypothetical protein Tco_1578864 [Tanacetum coccineum]